MKNEVTYCPACGGCGEDACCSGSLCKKNECLYGESYSLDYKYNKEVADRLYDALVLIDRAKAEKIVDETYDFIYKEHNESKRD